MQNIIRKNILSFLYITAMLVISHTASAQQKEWMVRLAKIEVDSAYLDAYKAAVKEHTEAALRLEPGVLTLYVMAEKEHPTHFTVLEIYASKEAYQLHLKSPHFIKYKTNTLKMVRSLQLVEVDPVAFAAKPDLLKK